MRRSCLGVGYRALIAALVVLAGCAGSDFAGSGNQKSAGKKPDSSGDKSGDEGADDDDDDAGTTDDDAPVTDDGAESTTGKIDEGADNGVDINAGNEPAIVVDEGAIKAECKVNVGYNPTDVRCNLNVAGPNIWTATAGWQENVAVFRDRAANWISPLDAAAPDGHTMCPHVPSNEKLIYVSHFVVPAAGDYTVEILNDNTGNLRLWARADPAKEVLNMPSNNAHAPRDVKLGKGHHSVVVDGLDSGVASAIVVSVHPKGNPGAPLKNTKADGSWCIFRVPAATDVASYTRDAAACRPCLVGP